MIYAFHTAFTAFPHLSHLLGAHIAPRSQALHLLQNMSRDFALDIDPCNAWSVNLNLLEHGTWSNVKSHDIFSSVGQWILESDLHNTCSSLSTAGKLGPSDRFLCNVRLKKRYLREPAEKGINNYEQLVSHCALQSHRNCFQSATSFSDLEITFYCQCLLPHVIMKAIGNWPNPSRFHARLRPNEFSFSSAISSQGEGAVGSCQFPCKTVGHCRGYERRQAFVLGNPSGRHFTSFYLDLFGGYQVQLTLILPAEECSGCPDNLDKNKTCFSGMVSCENGSKGMMGAWCRIIYLRQQDCSGTSHQG